MSFKSLEIELGTILDEYEHVASEVVEKAARTSARSAVNKLKNTSPRKTGEYASGWASKKQGHGYVVYNRKAPGLTHLLEKGHVTRNKYGTYGRTPAHVHIAPVEAEAVEEFEQNIRKGLNRS